MEGCRLKRRAKIGMIGGAFLLSASIIGNVADTPVASAATSEVQEKPSISGFISHAELSRTLNKIEQTSKGTVAVEVAGFSNQGREIYKATIGSGKKVVLIQSEIHGNEKVGTKALLNMIEEIGNSNSPKMKQLREELTIVAMPMINPDATELNRRGNDMTWAEVVDQFPQLEGVEPSWNYYTYTNKYWDYASTPGFDVNRDFNPDLNYQPQPEDFPNSSSEPGWFITPEAQTVRDVYKNLQAEHGKVDVFVDLHHQGEYVIEGTDDPVTLSLSGVFIPHPDTPEGEKYSKYADDYNVDFSKQLNVAAYNALQQMGNSPFGNISLYPQALDLPGTALGSFALNGSGSVLFEVTGQTQNYGQKKLGQLTKAVETGVYGILEGVATEEVYGLEVEDYDDIPLTER